MESPRLAPGQAYPVITPTAEDLLATAEGRQVGQDQVERMLDLVVRRFDPRAVRSPYQAGGEMLAVGALPQLTLAPCLHPETQQRPLGFTAEAL